MRSQALISCSHCPPLWAFWNKEFFQPHGVWKSPKSLILHCQRSELRLHFEWKKVHHKCQKMVNFGEFLKTWSLRSNSGTRPVTFVVQKMVEKAKIKSNILSHFQTICHILNLFKNCGGVMKWDILSHFQTMCIMQEGHQPPISFAI